MRRGRVCGLWLFLVACAPGGGGKSQSVVKPNAFDSPAATGGAGTSGTATPPMGQASGDLFGGSSELGCVDGCPFSADPILDTGVAAADIAPFAASKDFTASSICVVEPQLSTPDGKPGALFPRNWLRPRFRWASSGGETLWEVRLHNESQPDDLVAYTKDTQWTLPKDIWTKMAGFDKPVTVTVRGLDPKGVISGTSGDFSIAQVDAGGSMVFWTTSSSLVNKALNSSKLRGFAVGDEAVLETLNPTQVQTTNIPGEDGAEPRGFYACGGATPRPTCAADPTNPACCNPTGFTFGQVECVGCHVATPDGKAVLFTDNWPWEKVAASIEAGTVGQLPATVTRYAADLLKQPWLGMQTLSPAYFDPAGARILVTSYGRRADPSTRPYDNTPPTVHDLAWFNLAATDPNPLAANQTAPLAPGLAGFPEYTVPVSATPAVQNAYQDPGKLNTAVGRARGVAWGLITTIGETRSAVTPAWSNDGTQIAYVSVDVSSTDGHPDWTGNAADIHVVPYNDHAGGSMTPLQGASDPAFLEYYPQFSADDAFITFTRAPAPSTLTRHIPAQDANGIVKGPADGYQFNAKSGWLLPNGAGYDQSLGDNPDGPYYNRNGEIYIVARNGGVPVRLAANDPVSCTNETSRGSINSWSKWSPRVEQSGGKHYYFLIFSSGRNYPGTWEVPPAKLTPAILHKSSQLYMAPIVVDDASGEVTTYPAIYLWNQNILVDAAGNATLDENTSNLTPAWNDFSIPPVPVPIQLPR